MRDGKCVVDIDRCGYVLVPGCPDFVPIPTIDFIDGPDGRYEERRDLLEAAAGLDVRSLKRPGTAYDLALLVLASVVRATENNPLPAEVRNEIILRGGENFERRGFLEMFPRVTNGLEQDPDPARFWCVLRGGSPVALIDAMGFAYVGNQEFNMVDEYQAGGRRITGVVSILFGSVSEWPWSVL
ncbi:hypothetical protein [Actinoplanes sp. NBRC 101535]|nr:hypothetical protein [Actinoplanes sp. NBRC 101535]